MQDRSSVVVFIVFACVFAATVLLVANASKNQNRKHPVKANQSPIVEQEKPPCENEELIRPLTDTLFNSGEVEFDWLSSDRSLLAIKTRRSHGFWGVVANDQFFIATYETDSIGHWHQTSCEKFLADGFKLSPGKVDVNFDGFEDIWIDASNGGVHGNYFSIVYLYDPKRRAFKRNIILEIENLSIDEKNKRLRSQHFTSIYGGLSKSIYHWKNDTLELLGETNIKVDVENDSTILTWREYTGGIPIERTIRTDDYEKALKKFNQLFWQTE